MAPRRRPRGKHSNSASSNRLIGWLVSYGLDNQGVSYEIRAGRTLISSNGDGGERSVTVSEPSICSPHGAVSATPKHEIIFQDIFSEHGTFLSRSGSEEEEKVNGPIRLEHGDFIRLGESTRFQVCLIEAP